MGTVFERRCGAGNRWDFKNWSITPCKTVPRELFEGCTGMEINQDYALFQSEHRVQPLSAAPRLRQGVQNSAKRADACLISLDFDLPPLSCSWRSFWLHRSISQEIRDWQLHLAGTVEHGKGKEKGDTHDDPWILQENPSYRNGKTREDLVQFKN